MKDRQVEPPSGQPRIPVVSALLHCVSMTILVYLRSSFGFVYLRPKSVFFAFSWAFALFTIYAWTEPGVWPASRAACLFGICSVALYWLHLLTAFSRELYRKGEHDNFSGNSHLLRFMRLAGQGPSTRFEIFSHIWAESICVLGAAAILRYAVGERYLSAWLVFAGIRLWAKESLNYWHHLRQRKRLEDTFADSGDMAEPTSANTPIPEPPKAVRKERVKRQRNTEEVLVPPLEQRYAEVLRLLPPFSLDLAEEHYRALIKTDHPDTNDDSPESTARSVQLNEAIEFFRARF